MNNDANLAEKSEDAKIKMRLASFYTSAAYLTLDVAYSFACDCDVILSALHKAFGQDDKRKIKQARECGDRLRHSLRNALERYKDILSNGRAADDSEFTYNVLKLVFDRTSDTEEGKQAVIDKIRELPSIMGMEQELYIDYTTDLQDIGETELQKQLNRVQSEYDKIAGKYKTAMDEAKKVAVSRLLLDSYANGIIKVAYKEHGIDKSSIGFYGGCKVMDGSNNIYLLLYDTTKSGQPSRRSPKHIKVTDILSINKE